MKPLLPISLAALSLALSACTTGRSCVERTTTGTNGVVTVERTTTEAKTLLDGKTRLADFKAGQSAKSQSIGIGEQSGESTSEVMGQLVNGLQMLGRLAAMTQGVPLPPPAPVVKTNSPPK